MATSPSSSSTIFPFASKNCVILFLALLCFVNAWKKIVLLLAIILCFFCFKNISYALRTSNNSFNAFAISSVIASSLTYMPSTFSFTSSTCFSESKLCCLFHSPKALWKLKICSIILASGGRSGDFHPSRIRYLSFSLSNHLLLNLNFFDFLIVL